MKLIKNVLIRLGSFLYTIPFLTAIMLPVMLVMGAGFLRFNVFDSFADMQPFYNLSVTIDRANEDGFNEKIEVYVEKDGQYYGDFDLNQSNQYLYKTELQTGRYRLFARVRYDETKTYQVEPEYQDLEMTDLAHKEMHEIVFRIKGGAVPEQDSESHEIEEQAPISDNVYTMDRIDELREIQKAGQEQASSAFRENEEWERNNNFLAQNNVADQAVPYESTGHTLPDHSYPEEETESSTLEESTTLKESETSTEKEQENVQEETLPSGLKIIKVVLAVLSVILVVIAGILVYRRRGKKQ